MLNRMTTGLVATTMKVVRIGSGAEMQNDGERLVSQVGEGITEGSKEVHDMLHQSISPSAL